MVQFTMERSLFVSFLLHDEYIAFIDKYACGVPGLIRTHT